MLKTMVIIAANSDENGDELHWEESNTDKSIRRCKVKVTPPAFQSLLFSVQQIKHLRKRCKIKK